MVSIEDYTYRRKGRVTGRVGSDFLSAIAGRISSGRVGSGQFKVSTGRRSGQVQVKWPVDM